MKIGHLTTHYYPISGGQEVYIKNLIQCTSAMGWENTVFQMEHPQLSTFNALYSEKVVAFKNIKIMPLYISYCAGIFSHSKTIKKNDVIIVNYPEYYRFLDDHPGVIILSHGATWGNLEGKRRKMKVELAKRAYDKAPYCVYNDTFAMREINIHAEPMKKMFEWIDDKAFFLPNCVDTAEFTNKKPIDSIARMNAICVPRNLNYGRGIDLAIDAFRLVLEKKKDMTLLIIGDSNLNDVTYRRFLFDKVNKLDLVGKVFFLGLIFNDSMPDIYSSCVVTLIPSRFREGTSLSALESMACGTPVVSTAVEGLLDLPTVHCAVDPKDMADKVIEAIESRAQIGANQQALVRANYSMLRWQDAWRSIIQRAAENR